MAADKTLVEGAYRAAKAQEDVTTAKMKRKTDIISDITKGVTDVVGAVEAEGKEYDAYVQEVIDNAGSITSDQKSKLYDDLEKGRKDYIWGTKKDKSMSVMDLNEKANFYKNWEDIRLTTAKNSDKKNTEGFSSSFSKEDRVAIMSAELKPKECPEGEENCPDKGKMGAIINGEWMSESAVKTWIDGNKVDTEFKKNINALADSFLQRSTDISPGQVADLPKGEVKRKVSQLLSTSASTGNIQSVAKDSMFGETSWYKDAMDNIMKNTYEGLGITDEQLAGAETNGIEGIQEDEATVILDAMMKDESALMDELNNYYFGFISGNWNNGAEGRVQLEEGYKLTAGGGIVKEKGNNEYIDPEE